MAIGEGSRRDVSALHCPCLSPSRTQSASDPGCESYLTGKDVDFSHARNEGQTIPAAELTQWVFYSLGWPLGTVGILQWQGTKIQFKLKRRNSLVEPMVLRSTGEGASQTSEC